MKKNIFVGIMSSTLLASLFLTCKHDSKQLGCLGMVDTIVVRDTIVIDRMDTDYTIDNYVNSVYNEVSWLGDNIEPDTLLVIDSINYYMLEIKGNIQVIKDKSKKDELNNQFKLLQLSNRKLLELSAYDREIYYYSQNYTPIAPILASHFYYARLLERYLFLKELSLEIESNYEE